jgi:hypothetical protein
MNRKPEARRSLKKVLELEPDHGYAKDLLKGLK